MLRNGILGLGYGILTTIWVQFTVFCLPVSHPKHKYSNIQNYNLPVVFMGMGPKQATYWPNS